MTLLQPLNVLLLDGEVDYHVSPEIAASLEEMIEENPMRVVVDLSRVSYIDSSGLAVLINGVQQVEGYGGRFMLAGVRKDVRAILEIAGLQRFFLIFPHVDAALAAP